MNQLKNNFSYRFLLTLILSLNVRGEIVNIRAKRIMNAPTSLNSNSNSNYKQNNRVLDTLLPGQMASGSSQTIFARGLETYHTKMEIDGIEANDPSGPNKAFNFNFAPALTNGKFQYLGPESNIYSSNLAASTINYQTTINTKGQNQLSFTNGSYGENKFLAEVSDKIELNNNTVHYLSYNLLANIDQNQGRDLSQNNGDKDGFDKKDYHLVIAGKIKHSHFKIVGHNYDHLENLDGDINLNGKYTEDPNNTLKSNLTLLGLFLENTFSDMITHKISYSKNSTKRQAINFQDKLNNTIDKKDKFTGTDNWIKNSLLLEDEKNSYFLEAQINLGNESSTSKSNEQEFEARYSKTQYGVKAQKEFGGAYLFAGTTVLNRQSTKSAKNISIGPGINLNNHYNIQLQTSRNEEVPSIFQLNAPIYGNKSLGNEVIKSRSASISYKNDQTNIKLTPFFSSIQNRFSFDPISYQSINSGKAEILGIQTELNYSWKMLRFNFNSIYQKAEDKKTGKQLLRRAPFSTIESIELKPNDKNSINISHSFKDKRDEFQGTLPSYNKWDVNFSQQLSEFIISFTVENFMNNKFQDTNEVLPAERTLLGTITWKI